MNRRKFNSLIAGLGASSAFSYSPSALRGALPLLAPRPPGASSAENSAGPAFPADSHAELKLKRSPWYHTPQLFVMTGFIANTTTGVWGPDFIVKGKWSHERQQAALSEWRKGLGRDYNADESVKAFRDAGATGVIFYSKWHDGLVNYPTSFTNFTTERDLLGDTLKALHKHKMKVVVYYSVGLDYNPDPKFLHWTCRDKNGKPLGLAFPTDWKSFYSPYRQYVMSQLAEISGAMDLSRASGWIFTLSRWCHTTGTRREPSSQNTESPLGRRRSKKLKNLCWTPCVSSWWKSSARCQPSSPAWASPGMAPGWTTLFVPKRRSSSTVSATGFLWRATRWTGSI